MRRHGRAAARTAGTMASETRSAARTRVIGSRHIFPHSAQVVHVPATACQVPIRRSAESLALQVTRRAPRRRAPANGGPIHCSAESLALRGDAQRELARGCGRTPTDPTRGRSLMAISEIRGCSARLSAERRVRRLLTPLASKARATSNRAVDDVARPFQRAPANGGRSTARMKASRYVVVKRSSARRRWDSRCGTTRASVSALPPASRWVCNRGASSLS
jgi:hypothetical protein